MTLHRSLVGEGGEGRSLAIPVTVRRGGRIENHNSRIHGNQLNADIFARSSEHYGLLGEEVV